MRIKIWRLAVLIICGVGTARAEIIGPDSVPIHQLCTVSTNIEADIYVWFGSPIDSTFLADQADPRRLQFTGSPGLHEIVLVTIKEKKQSQYRKRIFIGPASPGPDPKPPPPGPDPEPIEGLIYGTLIYDHEKSDPVIATLRSSKQIASLANDLGIAWRNFDDNDPAIQTLNFGPAIQKHGIPLLIFQNKDGLVIKTVPAPKDIAGTIAIFKSLRSPP